MYVNMPKREQSWHNGPDWVPGCFLQTGRGEMGQGKKRDEQKKVGTVFDGCFVWTVLTCCFGYVLGEKGCWLGLRAYDVV